MEKKSGLFKVYTDKTKSALIDLGNGEDWHKVQGNAQAYFKKIEKNSECSFGFDGNELVYVKQEGKGQEQKQSSSPKPQNQKDESNKYNMQMSQLKNKINARTSALDNATKIAVADANLDTQEKMTEAVKTISKEFLQFIEEAEGENPSSSN